MRELAKRPWSWVLYQTVDGHLMLSANCGTVAAYEVSIKLNAAEVEDYKKFGLQSVDALAAQVTSNPPSFGMRNVRMDGEELISAPLMWSK